MWIETMSGNASHFHAGHIFSTGYHKFRSSFSCVFRRDGRLCASMGQRGDAAGRLSSPSRLCQRRRRSSLAAAARHRLWPASSQFQDHWRRQWWWWWWRQLVGQLGASLGFLHLTFVVSLDYRCNACDLGWPGPSAGGAPDGGAADGRDDPGGGDPDTRAQAPSFPAFTLFQVPVPTKKLTHFPSYLCYFGIGLVGFLFLYFFGGLECVGHSFAYVAHLQYTR